jgi:predicted phosphate transport protein (TIGR00153 family)
MSFISIFKNRTGIEKEIDSFLNLASESGLIFIQGIDAYLINKIDTFNEHLTHIVETEKAADTLRHSIEDLLYRKTLIPESRGDVLELIERMDALLGRFKGVMFRVEIERPEIAPKFHDDLKTLITCVIQAVEAATLSLRAYFKDISQATDHIHKVSFWETEADKATTHLQKAIFGDDTLGLDLKMQLRDLSKSIDKIADQAEDLGDSLAIYVIKRSL